MGPIFKMFSSLWRHGVYSSFSLTCSCCCCCCCCCVASVVSDSVRPQRRQPTRPPPSLGFSRQEHWSGLPFPSPMHESESEVAQSCPTLSNRMDCSLPGSSVHGICQARVLEWVATAFSNLFLRSPQMRKTAGPIKVSLSLTDSDWVVCPPLNQSQGRGKATP